MTVYNPGEVERLVAEAEPAGIRLIEAIASVEESRLADPERSLSALHEMAQARQEFDRAIGGARIDLPHVVVAMAQRLRESRAMADQLRVQNRFLCEALAVAQAGMHAAKQRCRTMGEITDEALGLLFGLLTSTGPDRMNINDRRVMIQVAERLQRVQREASR